MSSIDQNTIDRLRVLLVEARAENARLQERVKEANEVMGLANAALNERCREVDLLKRERDEARVLAERRKKALKGLLAYVTEMAARTTDQPKEMLPDKRIGVARSAAEALEERR